MNHSKARPIRLYVMAVVALIVVVLGALFYFQNEATQVVLYLHLGFWTWQSSSPAPVPLLMLASFAAGLGVMGLYTVVLMLRRGRARDDAPVSTREAFASDDQVFDDF